MLGRLQRWAGILWRVLVGTLLSQYVLTGILVVGWTYRLMQRAAVKHWWRQSERRSEGRRALEAFLDEQAESMSRLPRWGLRQGGLSSLQREFQSAAGVGSKLGALLSLFRSLRQNLIIGLQAVLATFAITLLPVLLWEFGWYAGWLNSFFKGYEQYAVGIAISVTGIVLFLAVMLYVPIAQARHAVTGEWRGFFDFQVVRKLVRSSRTECLILAGLYSLLSIPVTVFKFLPFALPQINPEIINNTPQQNLELLNSFYFWGSIVGFVAFVALRLVATRIYSRTIVRCVKDGVIEVEDLRGFEREVLGDLGLALIHPPAGRPVAVELAAKAVRPAWRGAMVTGTVVLWFTFVAQVYVSEFFNYHPVRGFMNQPLVQVPWFRYVPNHLEEEVAAFRETNQTSSSGGERMAER